MACTLSPASQGAIAFAGVEEGLGVDALVDGGEELRAERDGARGSGVRGLEMLALFTRVKAVGLPADLDESKLPTRVTFMGCSIAGD